MKNFLPKQYKKTTKLKINHNYLYEQFSDYSKIFKEIEKVVKRGDYTLGQKVNEFEKNFAKRTGSKFVIGVGNGTDALFLSLKALNIGIFIALILRILIILTAQYVLDFWPIKLIGGIYLISLSISKLLSSREVQNNDVNDSIHSNSNIPLLNVQ